MISPRLFDRAVTVHHMMETSTRGTYGGRTLTDAATQTRGRLSRLSAQELGVGTDLALTNMKLFLPADVVVGFKDHVEVDGQTFDVVGDPYVVHDTSGPHHIEVTVNRVDA